MQQDELIGWSMVALVCLGMAAAFFLADRRSPASRALALGFASIGATVLLTVLHLGLALPGLLLPRIAGLFDGIAFVTLLEWVLRVRRTVPARALDTSGGDRLVRNGQLAGLCYGLVALLAPQQRLDAFLNALDGATPLGLWFWVFALPVLLVALAGIAGLLLLLRRQPDAPERRRVAAMLLAIPLLAASLALPGHLAPVSLLLGAMVFLAGAVQYHVEQGRRGEFMAQFLSPQVADLVRRRGLTAALQPDRLEISVVCVDLRGFTAVTAGADSRVILSVLARYYRSVGEIAARYRGTIKDQAGDGVLVLVGAPVPDPEHRRHALEMARAMVAAGARLSRAWRAAGLELGLGVGVASGPATVGVIGEGARMEYTAVGTVVNLAARLCQHAGDGEVLAAPDTVAAVDDPAWQPLPQALTLKGLGSELVPLRLRAA